MTEDFSSSGLNDADLLTIEKILHSRDWQSDCPRNGFLAFYREWKETALRDISSSADSLTLSIVAVQSYYQFRSRIERAEVHQ